MTATVCVFDYGAGNLHSLVKALEGAGAAVAVETDPRRAARADALVLPGVGAFAAAAARLAPGRADVRAALADGLPALGICLGMQLLLDASEEGAGAGVGLVPGLVTRLRARRVPQIGWNAVEEPREALLAAASLGTAYYANSFVCRPDDPAVVTAWSTHEADRFPAALRAGRTVGVQFHPEKSSTAGVAFVRAWVEEIARPGRGTRDAREGSSAPGFLLPGQTARDAGVREQEAGSGEAPSRSASEVSP